MAAELARLATPLGLLGSFPAGLEQSFRRWLDARMLGLLRQYVWALLMLGFLIFLGNMPKIFWFTPEAVRAADIRVFLGFSGVLLVLMTVQTVLVYQRALDRYFRYYVLFFSVIMLALLAAAAQAYADAYNRLFAISNFWICATVVFATGLHLPRACLLIMLLVLPVTLLCCLALGLTDGLGQFSWMLSGIEAFLAVFSYVMTRVHRQVFLQEGLQLHNELRLTELSEQLAEFSLRDTLTGVANRRRFDEVLLLEWDRARRQQTSLALLFIDIDHFRHYNDHYGHQAGDDCLRAVAFVLVDAGRRSTDLVARYSGGGFVLLLSDTTGEGGLEAAHRIRDFLTQAALPHATSEYGRVTASIGVAACVPTESGAPDRLLAAADAAVYQAKQDGRDKVRLATEV